MKSLLAAAGIFFFSVTLVAEPLDPAACGDAVAGTYTSQGYTIPLHELERVPKNEALEIRATLNALNEFANRPQSPNRVLGDEETGTPPPPDTRLSVDLKSHGGLEGVLTINSNLSARDRVGIFKDAGKSFRVRAKFFNASPVQFKNDHEPDSRDIALKVFTEDYDQARLLDFPGAPRGEQDFLFTSSPNLYADSVKTFRRLVEIGLAQRVALDGAISEFMLRTPYRPFLSYRLRRAFRSIQTNDAANPLAINYSSGSAFQFGPGRQARVVKYALRPCEAVMSAEPDKQDQNFLRGNLRNFIATRPACFRLLIQDHYSGAEIEDLTKPWDEARAPFHEIARLEFPAQALVDDPQVARWEFNIWNTTAEHQPLGALNRLRFVSYIFSTMRRQATNFGR